MTESNKLSALHLIDLEPYILGKVHTGEIKNQPRLTTIVFTQFMEMVKQSDTAQSFIDAFENYKDFYKTELDFKALIPKEYQAEAFYAAKNGKFYVEIPSFCVYMLNRAWEESKGIPNLMLKLIPFPVLTEWFKKGYFLGGLTLRDVICNICCESYNPLSISHLKNRVGDFTEIYVEDTDMVAAVPNAIADMLDDTGVLAIKETPDGLSTNQVLLRTMAGYLGAIRSIYDLRELV